MAVEDVVLVDRELDPVEPQDLRVEPPVYLLVRGHQRDVVKALYQTVE
jgi:hypothetical protein